MRRSSEEADRAVSPLDPISSTISYRSDLRVAYQVYGLTKWATSSASPSPAM